MKKFNLALIGKDVSKSTSPQIHLFNAKHLGFEISYTKISIPEDEFEDSAEGLFQAYDGFNVTIPYKLKIMPYLKNIEGDAKVFGAVNTVNTKNRSGDNTDGLGFALMLRNNGVDVNGKEVLLLGAGGAGRSVAKKLAENGAKVFIFDKNTQNAKNCESEFENVFALNEIKIKPYHLIVNATGVGMHKSEGISPVGEELLSLCEVAIDLIYAPEKSRFLQIAEGCGKKIINGKAMLFYQAYYSDCIWFGLKPSDGQAKELFEKYCGEEL